VRREPGADPRNAHKELMLGHGVRAAEA
jgi:hypothetical protein